MWSRARREIHAVVDSYCREPSLHSSLVRSLERPGFPLHRDAPHRSGALTVGVYESIRGEVSGLACRGAAAVEIQMAASYMLDHVVDDEVDPAHHTSLAEELAIAISLLQCAAGAAGEVLSGQSGCVDEDSPLLAFHRSYLDACAGQLFDLRLEHTATPTTDFALEVTVLKAGSLGRLAAVTGASIAGFDADGVGMFGDVGSNLFTYLQLIDDLRDALGSEGHPGDLAGSKKTLPVVFFHNSCQRSGPERGDAMENGSEIGGALEEQFEFSGARTFCAIVAETFLSRARDGLMYLRNKGPEVDRLAHMVDDWEVTAEPVLAGP